MTGRLASDPLDAPRAAEAAARRSYGKLIAFLAARTHDVAGAEDALSEALAVARCSYGKLIAFLAARSPSGR